MQPTESQEKTPVKKKSVLKTVLRWAGIALGAVVVLIIAAVGVLVWVMTPERLTPLIEHAANEALDAKVDIKRAELTLWSTFPRLTVTVDSLTVTGDAFKNLAPEQRQLLPADADTLLTLNSLSGGLNVLLLPAGQIRLHDIELDNPRLNIVSYNDSTTNYAIAKASHPGEEEDGSVSLPDITLDRFILKGKFPIRYYSAADTTEVNLILAPSKVLSENATANGYNLTIASDMNGILPPDIKIDSITCMLDGKVSWHHDTPTAVALSDFTLALNEVKSKFDTELDFGDPLTVRSFDITIGPVTPTEVLDVIPQSFKADIKPIDTDMEITVKAQLTRPYAIDSKGYPFMTASVDIPETRVKYDKYTVNDLELHATADINGDDINASTVNITTLTASADGVDLWVKGKATDMMTDPSVDAEIRANANLERLPASVKAEIPGSVKGVIELDTKARLRQSYLSKTSFHKIKAEGELTVRNLDVSLPESDTYASTHAATFKLGTSDNFIRAGHKIDSLLTASISIDTLSMRSGGIAARVKNLKAGVGCVNRSSSKDTTAVNPIGGTIKAESLYYNDEDSTIVVLRDVIANAALRRFNNEAKVPLLNLSFTSGTTFYADKLNRAALIDAHFSANAHLRPKPKLPKRLKFLYDSIASANPGLSPDSIAQLMRKSSRSRNNIRLSEQQLLDFGLDGSTRKLLHQWDANGAFTADRGLFFTPYFPLRNRISNVNVTFSTDSVVFKDVSVDVGKSDFVLNGSVRNIRRALTSSRPLRLDLSLLSDTLNINEIMQAVYKGSAFAEKIESGEVKLTAAESEKEINQIIDSAAISDETAAVLIPMNINAGIKIGAAYIFYSDLVMNNFSGEMLINNGAVNLRDLSAFSNIGGARLTALYTAPTKENIRFGFGLTLNDIHVNEFIHLMPAVDSLMPLLQSFEGRINADIAATSDIDSMMNLEIPSLHAAIKLQGDSLTLLDAETFRTVSKWLMFKNKKVNMIPHMQVEMLVQNSTLQLFPFVFDFDRYKLAVMGSNDLALNYKYHISVLKSPVPFKFGINISGNADKMKVRLGGAKYKPGQAGETIAIVDTTRINLLREIDRVFRRGSAGNRLRDLNVTHPAVPLPDDAAGDTISHSDSLLFIKEGLIEAPDTVPVTNETKK